MKQVGEELTPGSAALFVLVRKATGDKVRDSLSDFAGTGKVLQTSLDHDSEEALREVFEQTG